MEGKVEAVPPAGKKSRLPADGWEEQEEDAMAVASSSLASPASTFAFLAPHLSLLRHVAGLCAGYLGLDAGLKPPAPAPAPASSSSSAAAAAAAASSHRDEIDEAAASIMNFYRRKIARRWWCLRCDHEGSHLQCRLALPGNPEWAQLGELITSFICKNGEKKLLYAGVIEN